MSFDYRRMAKRVRRVLPAIRRAYMGKYDISQVFVTSGDDDEPRVVVRVQDAKGSALAIEYRDLLQPRAIAERFGEAIRLAERH